VPAFAEQSLFHLRQHYAEPVHPCNRAAEKPLSCQMLHRPGHSLGLTARVTHGASSAVRAYCATAESNSGARSAKQLHRSGRVSQRNGCPPSGGASSKLGLLDSTSSLLSHFGLSGCATQGTEREHRCRAGRNSGSGRRLAVSPRPSPLAPGPHTASWCSGSLHAGHPDTLQAADGFVRYRIAMLHQAARPQNGRADAVGPATRCLQTLRCTAPRQAYYPMSV